MEVEETTSASQNVEDFQSGASTTSQTPKPTEPPSNAIGFAALFSVAVLWGSYAPSLRYLFESPQPPSAGLVNFLQAFLASLFLALSSAAQQATKADSSTDSAIGAGPLGVVDVDSDGELCVVSERGQTCVEVRETRRAPKNALDKLVSNALFWRSGSVLSAGAELGIWMCLAFGLELYALETVPATRASFIMQSQVIVTPILVWLSRVRVKENEWAACLLGLLGSSLVVLDGLMKATSSEDTIVAGSDTSGYILLALSVISYSLWIVRLGRYSSQFAPLELTLTKNSFLSLYSLVFLLLPLPGSESFPDLAKEVTALFTSPEKCLLIAWLGLGPSALAGYLQAVGQKAVPAAQAQVIYTTTPLFASAIAFFLLDASEEAMGGIAWVGAGLMILASVVASRGRED